jgi:hypothetical protein
MFISPLGRVDAGPLARLAAEFPAWNIQVRSQSGRWLATREVAWDWHQFAAGCRLFVAEDTPDDLAAALVDQEQRAASARRATA